MKNSPENPLNSRSGRAIFTPQIERIPPEIPACPFADPTNSRGNLLRGNSRSPVTVENLCASTKILLSCRSLHFLFVCGR